MVRSVIAGGGKGSDRRPRSAQVSQIEMDLRWDYAYGKMSLEEFNRRLKKCRKVPNDKQANG